MFNYSKPAKDVLLDLIYASNGVRFSTYEISFGLPMPLDQRPDDPNDPNAYIDCRVPLNIDSRYEGSTGFMYHRMDLDQLIPVYQGALPAPAFPFSTWDILSQLSGYFGTEFTQTDLLNTVYTDPTQPISITAASTALLWIGSTSIVDHAFDELITVPVLDGFTEFAQSSVLEPA